MKALLALFLWGGSECNTRGNSVSLPTMDTYHDYRLEVDTATGAIDVYYDGQHSGLTGTTLVWSPGGSCSAGTKRILWGDSSILAYGTSEWAYFEHNAGATGTVVSYCTAGTSASGCQATLSTSGAASVTASSGFHLLATNVEGNKDGLYFPGAGAIVQAQLWHRDPMNTSNQTTGMSNAVEIYVCP